MKMFQMISGRVAGILASTGVALLLSLLSSCSGKDMDGYGLKEGEDFVEVAMDVAVGTDAEDAVKGRFSGSETSIGNCFVAAFRTSDGVLMDSGYSGAGRVVLRLLKGASYDFYAVANCGDISSSFPSGITVSSVPLIRVLRSGWCVRGGFCQDNPGGIRLYSFLARDFQGHGDG